MPQTFVVPRWGAVLDRDALIEFCRVRLAKFKTPAEIEVTTSGHGRPVGLWSRGRAEGV